MLKQQGALEAKTIASELNVTPMAVRQHLYQLQDEKLLTHYTEARPVGRPAKLWELTAEADQYFPDAHASLVTDLISSVSTTFGKAGLEQLVATRSKEQIAQYKGQISENKSIPEKLKKLAEIRTSEGYMAEVLEEPSGGHLFVENHCPICVAAASCSGLCSAELDVFRSVMGNNVKVERAEHILEGARRCAYTVSGINQHHFL